MSKKAKSVELTPEALEEIKSKYNLSRLGKALNFDTAQKILNGNANITLRNYCKLCELMEWEIPSQLILSQEK